MATPRSAQPTVGDLNRQLRAVNRWREQYNPLRGLTLARAVSMLEAGERGEYADLQWAYRFIERRNSVCRALLARRSAALLRMDWNIKVVDNLPRGKWYPRHADHQRKTLRAAYNRLDNFREVIRTLALAEFRGYAILQKQDLDGDGLIDHIEPLHTWNWLRDGMDGDWYWNPEAKFASAKVLGATNRIGSDALPRDQFVIRECSMPIDEIALVCHIRKALSQKDWDAFIEIYGIPSGVVMMPPNVPAGKESEYEDGAARIASGGNGALPHGSDYKPNDQPRGVNPFKDHLTYQDQELVLAGTSGKLTMLAESGSGTLAGGAHQKAFEELAIAEALEISEILQQQFDAAILAAKHPGQPALAYFELAAKAKRDVSALADQAVKFTQAGLYVDARELSEKTGLNLTHAQLPIKNRETEPREGRMRQIEIQRNERGHMIGATLKYL